MTLINTNVGALMACTYATKSVSRTETSMERLSSGPLVNGVAEKWLCSFVAGVSKVPNKLTWRFGSANLVANSHPAQ